MTLAVGRPILLSRAGIAVVLLARFRIVVALDRHVFDSVGHSQLQGLAAAAHQLRVVVQTVAVLEHDSHDCVWAVELGC